LNSVGKESIATRAVWVGSFVLVCWVRERRESVAWRPSHGLFHTLSEGER